MKNGKHMKNNCKKNILYETYILTNNLCQNNISLVESETCVELYTNW